MQLITVENDLRSKGEVLWQRGMPLLFALLLAIVEFFSVMGDVRPTRGEIQDAFFSAALVYALYATVYMVCGLIPSQRATRRAALPLLHGFIALVSAILFCSWAMRWFLGQPLTSDATRVLLESPAASILHLRETEAVALGMIGVVLLLFIYLNARMLHFAASAWSQGDRTFRAAGAVALALGATLLSWRTANADLTWSSFAPVLSSQGAMEAVPTTYSCERTPRVLKTAFPQGAGNGAPVIVVVLESVRGDVLTKYVRAAPFLSRLAGEAVQFENLYSAATHSDFADISFWYSRHALYADHRRGYPPKAAWRGTSAFEYYKAFGYRTGYFSSQDERWGGMIHWMKIGAVGTFFDAWNYEDPDHVDATQAAQLLRQVAAEHTDTGKVRDDRTLDLAADWAERHADEPFFLGINLQNTHYPYVVPHGAPEPFQPAEAEVGEFLYTWPAERIDLMRNRYLNSVYNQDALVARFVERLRKRGLWDKAIVLFIGDHSEAFREHGYASHGGPAFEEIAKPVAVLKLPKGDRRNGTAFARPVSSIDMIPLISQLSGLPEWAGFQGRSPFTSAPGDPIFIAVNAVVRENDLVRWPWKFMSRSFPERSFALYHLETDPEEKHNLVRDNPDVAARLSAEVNEWRHCQISYYNDKQAHTTLQPPRYRWKSTLAEPTT